MNPTATYSPEDNKLRLYPCGTLTDSELASVKSAGFRWAPKQELFVAPRWTLDRAESGAQVNAAIIIIDKE